MGLRTARLVAATESGKRQSPVPVGEVSTRTSEGASNTTYTTTDSSGPDIRIQEPPRKSCAPCTQRNPHIRCVRAPGKPHHPVRIPGGRSTRALCIRGAKHMPMR